MKSLKFNGVLCLFALVAAVPALAFNDGLSFDNNVTVTPGNHTSIKKKHITVEHTGGNNSDDYNFIGVQGSLGLANQTSSGDGTIDSSTRLGMMFSAYYERRFIPYLGLRLEGGYNQRGFSSKDADIGGTDSFNINFMEFSLLVKSQFPTSIVTPFVAVGPFMGFAVAKSETNTPDAGPSQPVSTLDQTMNGFNFGFNFGGGIDFQIIRHLNFEIGARYSMGITNALTTAAQQAVAGQNGSFSVHLNDIQFLSGVSYSL